MSHHHEGVLPSILRLAQYQNVAMDSLALQDILSSTQGLSAHALLKRLSQQMQLKPARWISAPDPSCAPALCYCPLRGWGLLQGVDAQQRWVTQWWQHSTQEWQEQVDAEKPSVQVVALDLQRPFRLKASAFYHLVRDELLSSKRLLLESALAGIIINSIALATSFYTMQIYDRVIPTGARQTLLVLSLGVVMAIVYELVTKKVRSKINQRLINHVDRQLASKVYLRFLNVRLDQLPPSVGSLASQMRGYETVRGFLSSVASQLLIDVPFALLFVATIAAIAGKLALIPLAFFVLCLLIGGYYRGRIDAHAANVSAAAHFKTGLLVESVEGAETIKSGQGGWRMLSRWMNTADEARIDETQMRDVSEHCQYVTAACQQLSYIAMVSSGAILVSQGNLSMGGLIACSILSGRVLAPVAAVPGQLVQWAHTKAALKGLDSLWALQDDHHGQVQPVRLHHLQGHYSLQNVTTQYGDNAALQLDDLRIGAGEKVAVLGPIGAGKTTLLRLLSGMYKPQQGVVLLDDVDLCHIAKPVLAEQMGFVQQEGRLFAGSLRENLILGLVDPGDDAIVHMARKTGLMQAVISRHPQGLHQPIREGGTGLSGGQKQLVNLTRAFLRQPKIWLLDEPTASLDRPLERTIISALGEALQPHHTLVLVTHKPEMLQLVQRVIVIANHKLVMDGPRDQVMRQLSGDENNQNTAQKDHGALAANKDQAKQKVEH